MKKKHIQAPQNIKDPAGASFLTPRDRQIAKARARKSRMTQIEVRERLREKLRVDWVIEKIYANAEELDRRDELSPRAVAAIKVQNDLLRMLFDRMLPPLKAVEISREPTVTEDYSQMSTAELMALARRQEILLEGEYEVVEKEEESTSVPVPVMRTGDREDWPFG